MFLEYSQIRYNSLTMPKKREQLDDVVILIPTYNEGKVIKDTISGIPKEFKHIICIDDGSTDDTYKQILKTRATLVSHPHNMGQGAALQTAIDYALQHGDFKYFVTFDADGQHRIEDVYTMLSVIKKGDLDIVLGSRFMGEAINISAHKKAMLKLAVRFLNFTTGVKLTDAHNGLRVFNRTAAEHMQLQMHDFAHSTEIIERIAQKDLRYAEVPVTITYTDYSRAKGQSAINAINIVFDVVIGKIIRG